MSVDPIETPEIFVLGGPNGAGKSTAAKVLLPETLGVKQFVNADLIAQGLSPFAPESSALPAGRIMLQRMHQFVEERISFGFEATLAGRSHAAFLRQAQEKGYHVHVIYVWLKTAQLALRRVSDRVQRGGHDIPADVVVRRYGRGLKNLFDLYLPLANTWVLCDNSEERLVIIARGEKDGEIEILNPQTYHQIRGSIPRDS